MAENAKTVATTEHTPAREHGGGFPPFQSQTFASQLVWLAFTFVVLYVLMSKLALPRVGSIITEREKHIEGDIAAADRLKKESEEALAAYEKALADARARAQTIANDTRAKQAAEADAVRKKLEDQLNGRLAEAEKTIASTKEAAMANVRGIAVDAAKAIVERLIGTAPADSAVNAAVADALKR
jgi:F-type H+-transporting ATPase subunit b